MNIKKNDISTWPKIANLLYAEDSFQVAEELLLLEQKYFRRPYSIKRIKGRMKRLYARALINESETVLHGIKPSKFKNIKQILTNTNVLRSYIILKSLSLNQVYSILQYEVDHDNRKSIKRVLAAQIIKGGDYGVKKS